MAQTGRSPSTSHCGLCGQGIEAFIYWECEDALMHRVAQWTQIELKINVICSEIWRDDRVGQITVTWPLAWPALTPHSRLRHFQIGHSLIPSQVHPNPTICPEGEQRKISVQLYVSVVVFFSCLAFLRFEPAIISLNIEGWDQWLSSFRFAARLGLLTASLKPDYVRWIWLC